MNLSSEDFDQNFLNVNELEKIKICILNNFTLG